jgi:glycosyltransferase involved in cell wall biosynthesis
MPTRFEGGTGMTSDTPAIATKPTVSVIVPNYNHVRYLRQRVDSVLSQTYQDFELILLDDCSTDGSQEILNSYANDSRVRLEFNAKNSGSTFRQWNKGVRLARGTYVWIAESDDYADERLLEKLMSHLNAEPQSVLCYCRSWQVSADGELSGFLDSYLSHLDNKKWTCDFCSNGKDECRTYLVHCNTVLSASSVVFRRDVYWQVGGADESLVLCGDWKLWCSMAMTGGTISYVGEALNYYRFHSANVTQGAQKNGLAAQESLDVVKWIFNKLNVRRSERARVNEGLSHVWIPAVLNRRIPLRRRGTIFLRALDVDRGAPRRLLKPGLTALRLTLARRWRTFLDAQSVW